MDLEIAVFKNTYAIIVDMKLVRRGFTIVEISIFLAITGLLFVGITAGVQNSIFQQRYTDAVQSFADFLRNTYDEVLNVQSTGKGTTEVAIYGKVIVFGGSDEGGAGGQSSDSQVIRTYTLIGDIESAGCTRDDVFHELGECLGADVKKETNDVDLKGVINSYSPRWSTRIQTVGNLSSPQDFKGVVIIARHPDSGRVHTAFYDGTQEGEGALGDSLELNVESGGVIEGLLTGGKFREQEIDFCVNPNGNEPSNNRADVRIEKGASNASGVGVIMDSENKCRE